MSDSKKSMSYSPEFKASAIKLALESEQPVAETARDLGINKNTLYTWVSQQRPPQRERKTAGESEHLHDEMKRLRKENKQLREERDILKKAAAYFAKNGL